MNRQLQKSLSILKIPYDIILTQSWPQLPLLTVMAATIITPDGNGDQCLIHRYWHFVRIPLRTA